MALTFQWSEKVLVSTNSKTIRCFDAVMDEQKGDIPVRVFLIDKSDDVLKMSVFFKCKENDITSDTHISWVLGDIEELIGYDPNKTSRMSRWVAQFVDSFPEYVDDVFQSRY